MNMKRLVGLLMLTLVFSSAFAQSSYGLKGGASLTGMALEYWGISNAQYRLSYQVGFYGVQPVSERVFFRPELIYANKGFRAEAPSVTVGNPDEPFTMHLHYLSLPLLAGYSPSERLFVLLGPEISYLFAARSRFGSESSDVSAVWDEKLDIGLAAGVGYAINSKLSVDVRYVYGFRHVAPMSYDYQVIDPNDPLIILLNAADFQSRNRVFQLSAGYRLN